MPFTLFTKKNELNEVTAKMGKASPEELEKLLERMGEIQDELDAGGSYTLEMKIEEAARGLGLNAIGLDRNVSALSGGQRSKVLLAKLLLEQPQVLRGSSRYVFERTDFEIGYTHPLLPKMSITIERGEKITIIGCNRVGKSTLLKTRLEKIPPLSGKIEREDFLSPSYFKQEVKAENITPVNERE